MDGDKRMKFLTDVLLLFVPVLVRAVSKEIAKKRERKRSIHVQSSSATPTDLDLHPEFREPRGAGMD